MSPHPAFQRGVGYGDRFDAEIARHLDAGLNLKTAAARIGVSAAFVGNRARVLGHNPDDKPPLRQRPTSGAYTGSRLIAATLTHAPDDVASRLKRAMRQRLFVLDRDNLDPSHGIACLHLAGLTIPEIEGGTGYPASFVVAAVRQHCAPLGGSEARR